MLLPESLAHYSTLSDIHKPTSQLCLFSSVSCRRWPVKVQIDFMCCYLQLQMQLLLAIRCPKVRRGFLKERIKFLQGLLRSTWMSARWLPWTSSALMDGISYPSEFLFVSVWFFFLTCYTTLRFWYFFQGLLLRNREQSPWQETDQEAIFNHEALSNW